MNKPDYYKTLQVQPDAEPEIIEATYRRLSRKYHPDINPSSDANEMMVKLNEAYEVLSDPQKRATYDKLRATTHQTSPNDKSTRSISGTYTVACPKCKSQTSVNLEQTETHFFCSHCQQNNIALLGKIRSKRQNTNSANDSQFFSIRIHTFEGEELIETSVMGRPNVVFHSGDILIIVVNAYNRGKRSVFLNATIGTYYYLGRPPYLPVTYLLPDKKNASGGCLVIGILIAIGGIALVGCIFLSIAVDLSQNTSQDQTTGAAGNIEAVKTVSLSEFIIEPSIDVPQEKFQIRFTIDKIEVDQSEIIFYIAIHRIGATNLSWYGDEDNLDSIFLQAGEQVYPALATKGVFKDEQTELLPDEIYQGWIKFSRPMETRFSFHYPDMMPVEIDISAQ